MSQRVLITGGAGFIGSHLADALIERGFAVRVLDELCPQVHGAERRCGHLHREVELVRGDIRSERDVAEAVREVDCVFHFAAAVGVGQSMCEMARYTQINDVGTAVLLEALVRRRTGRLVVASSMSIYGEGLYRDVEGTIREYATRPLDCGVRGEWDPVDEEGRPLLPLPTPENKPPQLASVYALGKFVQERMSLMVGRAYGIPTVALRFFNVYGPRQALSNPYTGVLAIFASRLLNDRPPVIFEDGAQRRDFVHVSDVVRACLGAMERPEATGQVINVGSGRSISVIEAARALAKVMGRNGVEPTVRGEYRVGDVRHCFADISRARLLLGYEPRVTFEAGLAELAEWLGGQAAEDHVEAAHAELAARGLTR